MTVMKRRTLLGAALALTVAPAACSRGSGSSSRPVGSPRRGGTLVMQLPTEISSGINPFATNDPSAMGVVSGTVYSKLVEFKTGKNVNKLEVVPDLAKSWDISKDGRTYTFHLRDDVRWHDVAPVNGRPLVADDVVATFNEVRKPTTTHNWMTDPVEKISAPDEHTVVFELSYPFNPLLNYLAYHFHMVVPREGVEGKYDLETEAIGTGPFILENHKADVEWTLRRNPDYFVPGRPYVDKLDRPVISDIAAVTAALRSGRLDVGTTSDASVAEEFGKRGGFTAAANPGAQVSFYLNPKRKPFDDLRVRQAVVQAIDWAGMGKNIRGKYNLTAMLRPDTSDAALSKDEVQELRPFDPKRAKSLLAEAGLPNGFATSLVVQRVDDEDVREAQWIQADLKEIGVQVKIEVVDPATGIERRRNHDFDMTKALRGVHLPDQVWHDFVPESVDNYALVKDPQLTEMITKSQRVLDAGERDELYRKMQTRMEADIVQALYPIQKFDQTIANERVQNLWPSAIFQGRRLADVWLADA